MNSPGLFLESEMSIPKTIFGTTYQIPENNEEPWGFHTSFESAVADAIAGWIKIGSAVVPLYSGASSTLAAAATLTPAAMIHRVQGSGGPVTLSATTPIAAGTVDLQPLFLEGNHATNFVTILDGGTVDLNGDITLELGMVMNLFWNASRAVWVEYSSRRG